MITKIKKWAEIRRHLSLFKQNELLSLTGELYQLNDDNQYFLNARCSETTEEAIQPYKLQVKQFIAPEIHTGNERIQKAKAKKVIRNYWHATEDPYGKIDLMLYYVECGTDFTLSYGDIDEPFYNSLETVFAQAITEIKKLSHSFTEHFIHRLHAIVKAAELIGWGYGDMLKALYEDAGFPEIK